MKLTVEGLNSHYGPAHILFDIDLAVDAGEVVAQIVALVRAADTARGR